MKYVHLHGLSVSQFCIGTWHLPASKQAYSDGILKVDRTATNKVIRKAIDLGINFFDTANTYHGTISETHLHPEHSGNAEKILGEALSGYERESLVVATKVRAEVARFPNGGGLSRKHISWQIGESLKRLKMKYIDLYQIHWQDDFTPLVETMGILDDLVHRGLVHYLGVSNHPAASMEKMLKISGEIGYEKFITMQEPYSIAERDIEKDKAVLARRHGLDILAYVPLAQGILAGRYRKGVPDGSRASYIPELRNSAKRLSELVSRVVESSAELDMTPAQFSLAWLLRMQQELGISIVPIIGATSPSHVEENCAAIEMNIPNDTFRSFFQY